MGDLVVDAVPGLSLALARPAVELMLSIRLHEPSLAALVGPTSFLVQVPDLSSALSVKALAWASRCSPRDAVHVWRLLEVAAAARLRPEDWKGRGVRRDARRVLNDDFGRRAGVGARRASSASAVRTRIAGRVQQHVGRSMG